MYASLYLCVVIGFLGGTLSERVRAKQGPAVDMIFSMAYLALAALLVSYLGHQYTPMPAHYANSGKANASFSVPFLIAIMYGSSMFLLGLAMPDMRQKLGYTASWFTLGVILFILLVVMAAMSLVTHSP